MYVSRHSCTQMIITVFRGVGIVCLSQVFSSALSFFFKILFIQERHTERGRQRHWQREKQAPCREPYVGLYPRTPGSCPEPKADAQPLSHPGAPHLVILNKGWPQQLFGRLMSEINCIHLTSVNCKLASGYDLLEPQFPQLSNGAMAPHCAGSSLLRRLTCVKHACRRVPLGASHTVSAQHMPAAVSVFAAVIAFAPFSGKPERSEHPR